MKQNISNHDQLTMGDNTGLVLKTNEIGKYKKNQAPLYLDHIYRITFNAKSMS